MAGSVAIGAAGAAGRDGRAGAEAPSAERPDEVAAVQDGLERVPDQRIAFPEELEGDRAHRRRCQPRGDVDEQPPAGFIHPRQGGELEQGQPQGLHGVGHHLPMAD